MKISIEWIGMLLSMNICLIQLLLILEEGRIYFQGLHGIVYYVLM